MLGPDGHHESLASQAFPGWTAKEIHRAMNEPALSRDTAAALRRVGRTLGEAEGTGSHDDPILGPELRGERMEGRLQGLLMGVRGVFAARGLRMSSDFPARFRAFERLAPDAIMGAALACGDEADFLRRIKALSRR